MKFWNKNTKLDSKQRCSAPECQFLMKLTGEPPCNAVEELVKKIAGNRPELPLPWLRQQLCHALYAEELRRGGYVVDVGLVGPALFCEEAASILARIRPEFGYIREAGDTARGQGDKAVESTAPERGRTKPGEQAPIAVETASQM